MVDALDLVTGIPFIIYGLVAIIVVPQHIKHIYSQVTNSHSYKIKAAPIKAFSSLMYGLTIILSAILSNFWPVTSGDCLQTLSLQQICYRIALAAKYLSYIALLEQMGYSDAKRITRIRGAIIILAFVFTISVIILLAEKGEIQTDNDGLFPFKCQYHIPQKHLASIFVWVYAACSIVWDLTLSIGSIVVFSNLYEECKKDKDGKYGKLRYVTAKKFKSIVIAVSTLTIIWATLSILGQISIAGIFAGLDYFGSMIGLILMTGGWDKNVWYSQVYGLLNPWSESRLVDEDVSQFQKSNEQKKNNAETELAETRDERKNTTDL